MRKLLKLCTDGGIKSKQNILFLSNTLSATEARNTPTLWRFVMIIAQVNLFYAGTPVKSLTRLSLDETRVSDDARG